MIRRFFIILMCGLLACPPAVFAQVAMQPQASSALVPAQAETATEARVSRRSTLLAAHELAWRAFGQFNAQIPGMLLQKPDQSQLLFAPYHACKTVGAQATVADFDVLLAQVQTQIAAFLESHREEMATLAFEAEERISDKPQVLRIETSGEFCVPAADYSLLPQRGAWNLRDEERSKRQLEVALKSSTEPFLSSIARKKDSAPLSQSEARYWISWLSGIRAYRNSLALYEAYRRGDTTFSAPPALSVDLKVAQRLNQSFGDFQETVVTGILKKDTQGPRLTAAALAAGKLLNASQAQKSLPHFEPCAGSDRGCLVDGEASNYQQLDERITLALQDPNLKPGSYLEALITLAKRTSAVQIAAVNLMLPEKLKTRQLPNSCRIEAANTDGRFFTGAGAIYEKIVSTEIDNPAKVRWAQAVGLGVQQLVQSWHSRERTLNVPPQPSGMFKTKDGDSNLYQAGQKLVQQWAEEYFKTGSKALTDWAYEQNMWSTYGERFLQHWAKISAGVKWQLEGSSYEQSLRAGRGQNLLTDFQSLVAEKLVVLFGSIAFDLQEVLTEDVWDSRRELLVELVSQAVQSAFRDSLPVWGDEFLNEAIFEVEGIKILPNAKQQAQSLWFQKFDQQWANLLREHSHDVRALSEQIVTALVALPILKDVQTLAKESTEESVREQLLETVRQTQPVVEEAARAHETAEYMKSLLEWQSGWFQDLTWGDWNYHASASGIFPGDAPACFYLPNGDQKRYGGNPFGNFNPFRVSDHEFLQQTILNIAMRKHKKIEARLESHYGNVSATRATGLADIEDLFKVVTSKLGTLLRAEDTEDRGRLSELRSEGFRPLLKWLQSPQAPEQYEAFSQASLKARFNAEILPLFQVAPLEQGKQEGWNQYAQYRLDKVFANDAAIPTPKWEAIREAFAKTNPENSRQVQEALSLLQKTWAEIPSKELFFQFNMENAYKAFQSICDSEAGCARWFKVAQDLSSGEVLRPLFEARVAEGLYREIYKKVVENGKTNLTAIDLFSIVRASGVAALLRSELGAALDKTGVQSAESLKDLGAKIAALRGADKKAFPKTFEAEAEKTFFAKIQKSDLSQREFEALTRIQAFLNSGKYSRSTSAKQLEADVRKFVSEQPQFFSDWNARLSALSEAGLLALQTNNDAAKREALFLAITLWGEDLAGLLGKNGSGTTNQAIWVAGAAQAQGDFYKDIAREYVPSFQFTRDRIETLVANISVPQAEARARIGELEKTIRNAGDAIDALKRKGTTSGAEYDAAVEVYNKSIEQRVLYVDRYDSAKKLVAVIAPWASKLPEAAEALKILSEAKSEKSLFDILYTDYRNEKEKHAKYELSAQEILQDLNEIGKRLSATREVALPTARAFLQEVQQYCRAAFLSESAKASLQARFGTFGLDPNNENALTFCQKTDATAESLLQQTADALEVRDGFLSRAWVSVLNKVRTRKVSLIPAGWFDRYWDFVEYVTPVLYGGGVPAEAVFYSWQGKNHIAQLTASPVDAVVGGKMIAPLPEASLWAFFESNPSAEVLEAVGKLASLVNVKELAGKGSIALAALDARQRAQLQAALQFFWVNQLLVGGPGVAMLEKWHAGEAVGNTSEAVVKLERQWRFYRSALAARATLDASREKLDAGAWSLLARAFVQRFIEASDYRIARDVWVLKTDDVDGVARRSSLDALNTFAQTSPKILESLANGASDIVQRGSLELVLKREGATKTLLPGEGFFLMELPRYTAGVVGPNANDWAAYAVQAKSLRSSGAMTFEHEWKPKGEKGAAAEAFETWQGLLRANGAEDVFAALKKNGAGQKRARLWNIYASFAEMQADADGPLKQLSTFFARWDRNAAATEEQRTYPYFLALLHWNLHHYAKRPVVSSLNIGDAYPEAYLAYHLGDIVEELKLKIDDFESWKTLLVSHSQPVDWHTMAKSKYSSLVEFGRHRFLSGLIEAPMVQNPYWGENYKFRPFPIVDASERTELAPAENYQTWAGKQQDHRYTQLYSSLAKPADLTSDPLRAKDAKSEDFTRKVGVYQQLLADSLEMQGESTVELLNGKDPAQHTVYKTHSSNWENYFAQALRKVPAKELMDTLAAAHPQVTREAIQDLLQKREAVVALRRALGEFVLAYDNESTTILRNDQLSFQNDLNKIVAAFASQMQWKETLPLIDVTHWTRASAHRQGVGKAVYLGSKIAFGKSVLGADKTAVTQIFGAADKYYRERVQVDTYQRGLLATNQRNFENLDRLCSETSSLSSITTEEQLKEKRDTINALRLPLMDGLFQTVAQITPPGASDAPRRMVADLISEQEREKADAASFSLKMNLGMMALMMVPVLLTRSPALARLAATSPMIATAGTWLAVGANIGLPIWLGYETYKDQDLSVLEKTSMIGLMSVSAFVTRNSFQNSFQWWMGLYWAEHAYDDYQETHYRAPRRAEEVRSIRDTHYVDVAGAINIAPLMSNQSATLTLDSEQALAITQQSRWGMLGNAFSIAIAASMVGAPLTRWMVGLPRQMLNGSRAFSAHARERLAAWWTRSAYRADATGLASRTEAILQQEATAGLKTLQAEGGMGGANAQALWDDLARELGGSEAAAVRVDKATQDLVTKRLAAWEIDGQLGITDDWKDLFLMDIREQIRTTAQMAGVSAESVTVQASSLPQWVQKLANTAEGSKMQKSAIDRIVELQTIETKLLSSVPHLSTQEVKSILLGGGMSPLQRHTPWFAAMFGSPTLNPRIWRLRNLYASLKRTDDMRTSLAHFYASRWMQDAGKDTLAKVTQKLNLGVEKQLSETEVLNLILEGKLFAGSTPEVGGELGDLMMALAKQLRGIYRLGQFPLDDAYLAALASGDVGTWSKLAKQGKAGFKPGVAKAEGAPASDTPAAAPQAPVAPKPAKDLMSDLEPTRLRVEFAPYRASLEKVIPKDVNGIPVDSERVLKFVENASAEQLDTIAARYLRENGIELDSALLEVRLARFYRRALELDGMVATSPKNQLSDTFKNATKSFGQIEMPSLSEMSVDEARSVVGLRMRIWNEAQVELASQNFTAGSANRDAMDEALAVLSRFSTRGIGAQRPTFQPSEALRVAGVSPGHLGNDVAVQKVLDGMVNPGNTQRLLYDEWTQLSGLLSKTSPDLFVSQRILRVELPAKPTERFLKTIYERHDLMTQDLNALKGQVPAEMWDRMANNLLQTRIQIMRWAGVIQ